MITPIGGRETFVYTVDPGLRRPQPISRKLGLNFIILAGMGGGKKLWRRGGHDAIEYIQCSFPSLPLAQRGKQV
jgi:hypothetical protein